MAVFKFDPTREEMVLDLSAYGYGPNDNVKLETVGEFIYDPWGNRADPLAANVMGRWEFLYGWTWSIREYGFLVRLSTRDDPVDDNESTGHFGAEMTRVLFSEFDDHVDLSAPVQGPLDRENLTFAMDGDDVIQAPDAANQVYAPGDWLGGGPGADKLFGGAAADHFDGGEQDDSVVGRGGEDRLGGGEGNDTLWGGPQDDHLHGDWEGGPAGRDELYGGAGDDLLFGGAGRDVLWGGKGEDTAVVHGGYDPEALSWNGQGKSPWIVLTDGRDRLRDVEFVQFEDDGQRVPLTRWRFDIDRADNGKATVALREFGPDGTKTLWKRKAHFDDATPIAKGTYEAALRTNSANGVVVELMDQATGASTTPGRSLIQLHQGASPQNSDGCVVLKNWETLLAPITEALSGLNDHNAGGKTTKRLPDGGIEVRFRDQVEQPTLSAKVKDGKKGMGFVTLRVEDGADDKISKWIKLSYKLSEDVEISAVRGVKSGSLSQSGDTLEFMVKAKAKSARLKVVSDDANQVDPVEFDLQLSGVNFYRKGGNVKQGQEPWQMRRMLLENDADRIDVSVDLWD